MSDEEQLLKADGFDKAVLGVGRRCGQPDLLVYDYNVVGAWVGELTPVFVNTDKEEISELYDLSEVQLDGKTTH